MTQTRVALIASGGIAAVLALKQVVEWVWNVGAGEVLGLGPDLKDVFGPASLWGFVDPVLYCAAFGFGVFLSIRYNAPVSPTDSWRRTVTRGIIATATGAVAALLYSGVRSVILAIAIGPYPFGHAFTASFNAQTFESGLEQLFIGAIGPLFDWLPITVLACVFLKIWLEAHPVAEEVGEHSLSAT